VSGFPIGDWQFWVVTAAALVAALWLLRALVPRRFRRRARRRGTRASLTVGGKAVDR
jgi:predicted permease